MRRSLWTYTGLFVLAMAGVALAQAAGGSKQDAAAVGTGILATGFLGGLWKGVVAGVGRAFMGYWSKPAGTEFESQALIAACVSGAVAGAVMGAAGVPFDTAYGWIATFGLTEIINKAVKGLWNRWFGGVVAKMLTRQHGK